MPCTPGWSRAGLAPMTEPADAPWGERYFHVRDPDGHELSFARPLDPDARLERRPALARGNRSPTRATCDTSAMVDVARFEVGAVTLTRVPYFDVALDPAAVGAHARAGRRRRRVGRADLGDRARARCWSARRSGCIESQGRVIVVDPCGAADAVPPHRPRGHRPPGGGARRDGRGRVPARAGRRRRAVPPRRHRPDRRGRRATGRWTPGLPRGPDRAHRRPSSTSSPPATTSAASTVLRALIDAGRGRRRRRRPPLTDEVVAAHQRGPLARPRAGRGRLRGERAVLIGHLAISPLHVAVGRSAHDDARRAQAADRGRSRPRLDGSLDRPAVALPGGRPGRSATVGSCRRSSAVPSWSVSPPSAAARSCRSGPASPRRAAATRRTERSPIRRPRCAVVTRGATTDGGVGRGRPWPS